MIEPRHDHNGECLRCDEPWGSCTCGCSCTPGPDARELRDGARIMGRIAGHIISTAITRPFTSDDDDRFWAEAAARAARRAAHFAAESLKL